MGGLGKSELAIYFANQHRDYFSLIWEISCESEEERMNQYRLMADSLEIYYDPKISPEALVEKVHHHLEQNTEKPWLLFFDNYKQGIPFPNRGGAVLLTTHQKPCNLESIEVSSFEEQEALHLLRNLTKQDSPYFDKLLEYSGCVPLLVAQIGSYLARTNMPVKKYIEKLGPSLHHLTPSERYRKTFPVAIDLTLNELSSQSLQWLSICSRLGIAEIPFAYIEKWLELSSSYNANQRFVQMQKIGTTLKEFGLIRIDQTRETFTIHANLHRLFRNNETILKNALSHKKLEQDTIQSTLDLLLALHTWDFDANISWKKAANEASCWASHVESLLTTSEIANSQSKVLLLSNLGNWKYQLGNYSEALRNHNEALKICLIVLGDKHPDTALHYNNVGEAFGDLGDYKKALEYQQKALEIRQAVLGENHSDTAMSYTSMGVTFGDLGDYKTALEYSQKALKIRRDTLGETHPTTALSYNNTGLIFGKLGDHKKALEYTQTALEIRRAVLGENHPTTAASYHNVGWTFRELGDHKKALEYGLKALEIWQVVLGENHPTTALSYMNVGKIFGKLEDHKKALEYTQKALKIQQTILAENHPIIAWSYTSVGTIFKELGDYKKALEYFQIALEIRRETLGESHLDTATSYNYVEEVRKKICKDTI